METLGHFMEGQTTGAQARFHDLGRTEHAESGLVMGATTSAGSGMIDSYYFLGWRDEPTTN